jgi:hypothetical protein
VRIDLYTTIHKAQRFHLFELANAIGGADLENDQNASTIAGRVRHMFEHLRDHAHNEERYIHPLFDAAGTGASPLRHEHGQLEADLQEIERVLGEGRLWDLYAAYACFVGKYLLHLKEEEEAQKEVLWRHYDDDTLRGVLDRFKSERPRARAAADLEFMLPALSTPELVNLFRSMKHSVGPDVFGRACDEAIRVLGAHKWQQVADEIAARA